MAKTYYRPLGICYGPDAEILISQRRAGLLGGHARMAFTEVECISRDGKALSRKILPYADVRAVEDVQRIEAPRAALGRLTLDAPKIMGIVNVTPDSFSDGGQHGTPEAGAEHGERLTREGAHLLDIGGESTRPGSTAVSLDEELNRVIPAISQLAKADHFISVDTRKAQVMREAAKAGASMVNDVSALTYDPEGLATIAALGLPVVLMHAQGDPRTMQLNPTYDNVALDVYDYLEARIEACLASGIAKSSLAVDPGIGFGKTFQHNLEVLNQMTIFHGLGVAVLLGLSRKAFIGALTGEKLARNRVNGSVGGAVQAALNGVHILRVHDVKPTVEAIAVAMAVASPTTTEF